MKSKKKKTIFPYLFLVFFFLAFIIAIIIGRDPTERYLDDSCNLVDEIATKKIVALGKELEEKTGVQIKVVTVKSKGNNSIEEYAVNLFRELGLGQKDKDNGILLLIVLEDREMRIEVGYGIESIIPDGKAGRIRDMYILSYFKEGKYSQGIYNGYLTIASEIEKEYDLNLTKDDEALQNSYDKLFAKRKMLIRILLILFGLSILFGVLSPSYGSSKIDGDNGDGGGSSGGSSGGGGASGRW